MMNQKLEKLNELAENADNILRVLDQSSLTTLLSKSSDNRSSSHESLAVEARKKHDIETTRDLLTRLNIAINRVLEADETEPDITSITPTTPSKPLKSPTVYPLSISPVKHHRIPGKRVIACVKPLLSLSRPAQTDILPHIGFPVPASLEKPYKHHSIDANGAGKSMLVPTGYTNTIQSVKPPQPAQLQPAQLQPAQPQPVQPRAQPIAEAKQSIAKEKPVEAVKERAEASVTTIRSHEMASKRAGRIFSNLKPSIADGSMKRTSPSNSVYCSNSKIKKVSSSRTNGDSSLCTASKRFITAQTPNVHRKPLKPELPQTTNRRPGQGIIRNNLCDQTFQNRTSLNIKTPKPEPRPQRVHSTRTTQTRPRKPNVREVIAGNQTMTSTRVHKATKPPKPGSVAGSVAGSATGSATVPKPAVKPAIKPMPKPVPKPVPKQLSTPAPKPAPKPTLKPTLKPILKPAPNPSLPLTKPVPTATKPSAIPTQSTKPLIRPKEQGTPKHVSNKTNAGDQTNACNQTRVFSNLIPHSVLQDIDELSMLLADTSIANSTGFYDISNIDYEAKWLEVPESEKEMWVSRNQGAVPGHIFGELAPINTNQIFPPKTEDREKHNTQNAQ